MYLPSRASASSDRTTLPASPAHPVFGGIIHKYLAGNANYTGHQAIRLGEGESRLKFEQDAELLSSIQRCPLTQSLEEEVLDPTVVEVGYLRIDCIDRFGRFDAVPDRGKTTTTSRAGMLGQRLSSC